jgi:hypothetical protein
MNTHIQAYTQMHAHVEQTCAGVSTPRFQPPLSLTHYEFWVKPHPSQGLILQGPKNTQPPVLREATTYRGRAEAS